MKKMALVTLAIAIGCVLLGVLVRVGRISAWIPIAGSMAPATMLDVADTLLLITIALALLEKK